MNQTNQKILTIIPARGGSKGLPNKNISLFKHHPLIAWPIEYAKQSEVDTDIIVSTDSSDIAEVAIKYGAKVPFLRTQEVSGDLTTTEETLKFSLQQTEEIYNKKYELCCFLTCTDLFRKPGWISQALNYMNSDPKLESVFVGNKTHKNFWENKKNSYYRLTDWMKVYSSRQVRQPVFREDTGLTCLSKSNLWREMKRIGDNVLIIEDNRFETAIDIHSKFDLDLANIVFDMIANERPHDLPPIPQQI
tara:strand:+ start:1686 stop:2429 length:744 start_codon:yes stop_codon:yes gene_type:complete